MTQLPRLQEHTLLKVHQLGPDCTANDIQEAITNDLAKEQSFGSIFTTLDRLNDKKYLTWKKGEKEERRGGRAPRLYTITGNGRIALSESLQISRAVVADNNVKHLPGALGIA